MEYNTIGVVLRTLLCRHFGRTDFGRWRDATNFDELWNERVRIIAKHIPSGVSVIDFGAGNRHLELALDKRSIYVPCDIVDRGPDTLILDLNRRPLPDLGEQRWDVAVFSGVLEYIHDLKSLVRWLSKHAVICIASYECARSQFKTWSRLRETTRRTGAGWVNAFTEEEIVEIFRSSGYMLKQWEDWHTGEDSERIFVFRK